MATEQSEYGSPNPLADADIRLFTQALIGMAAIGEKITFECMDNEPPRGSDVAGMFYRFDRESPSRHIMDAFLLIQHANLTGFDHVRSLVALMRTKPPRSTALATVTRGALEAFSRTWFLLGASDPGGLTHRQLSLLYSDLRHPASLGLPITTLGGDPADPITSRAFHGSELVRLGLPAPLKIELSRLVADLLDSEFKDGSGARRYSDLSSIAHGQRLGTNAFVLRDGTGGIGAFVAPREVAAEFVVESIASMSATMDVFIRVFGNNARHVDLFATATDRAARAMDQFS